MYVHLPWAPTLETFRLKYQIEYEHDYFAWSMRRGKDDNIESDLQCINPLTPSPEAGFY